MRPSRGVKTNRVGGELFEDSIRDVERQLYLTRANSARSGGHKDRHPSHAGQIIYVNAKQTSARWITSEIHSGPGTRLKPTYTDLIPDTERAGRRQAASPTGFSGALRTLGLAGNSKMPMSERSGG